MKPKQITLLLVIILVLMVAGLMFMLGKARQAAQTTSDVDPMSVQMKPDTGGFLATKTDTQTNIGVEVTPVSLSATSTEWTFDIAMNTHSGSLDADLTKTGSLTDDAGNISQPIRWDGDSEGGHHRAGLLTFKPITPLPKSVTLKLSGIGGVDRTFTWQLK
jgi:hypothetical protein